MVRVLFQKESGFSKKFEKLLEKRDQHDSSVEKIVEKIIQKIKTGSDKALLELTRKLDKFNIKKISDLRVDETEIQDSIKKIDNKQLNALLELIKLYDSFSYGQASNDNKDIHRKSIELLNDINRLN